MHTALRRCLGVLSHLLDLPGFALRQLDRVLLSQSFRVIDVNRFPCTNGGDKLTAVWLMLLLMSCGGTFFAQCVAETQRRRYSLELCCGTVSLLT